MPLRNSLTPQVEMEMESPIESFERRITQGDKLRSKAEDLVIQYLLDEVTPLNLKERIKELSQDFPDVAKDPAIMEIYYAGMCGWPWIGIPPERAKEYCDRLMRDLPRCLRPNGKGIRWLIEKLHTRVMFANAADVPWFWVGNLESPIAQLKLHLDRDFDVYPQTRKEDIEEWATQEVQRQVREQWKGIAAKPGYKQRLKEPKNLERDVKWLCRRIMLGYTGKDMGRVYPSDSKNYAPKYIDSKIRVTARLLGITLPKGRPPKAKKR